MILLHDIVHYRYSIIHQYHMHDTILYDTTDYGQPDVKMNRGNKIQLPSTRHEECREG
jgi:hypothetical protein